MRTVLYFKSIVANAPNSSRSDRTKSAAEKASPKQGKYILLKRFHSKKRIAVGLCKGVVHEISFHSYGVIICTEDGKQMTIKVS